MAVAKKTTSKEKKPAKKAESKEKQDGITKKSDSTKTEANKETIQVVEKPAKAGKRSPKGLKEAEEKQVKADRQHHADDTKSDETVKPAKTQKPARSRLERRGKKYQEAVKSIESGKSYPLADAVSLAAKTSTTKFDASIELHIRLGVDPRQADQNVRDTVILPAGTGKTIRVAVFAEAEKVAEAKKAGADIAAADEFLQDLDKEKIDFDILVATPSSMSKLGKYARLLGPKGLMPNPKSGTVTTDIAKAVKEAKAGRVEYRVDASGIVHVAIGKVSFGAEKLSQNAEAVMASIRGNKPSSLKGTYINTVYVTSSMGPSIPVVSAG